MLSPGSADEIPPLGDFEADLDEAPASEQATAVPDTPVPPAPFPQDVLQASEDTGMDLEELINSSKSMPVSSLDCSTSWGKGAGGTGVSGTAVACADTFGLYQGAVTLNPKLGSC